jgi:hypothetical protein
MSALAGKPLRDAAQVFPWSWLVKTPWATLPAKRMLLGATAYARASMVSPAGKPVPRERQVTELSEDT